MPPTPSDAAAIAALFTSNGDRAPLPRIMDKLVEAIGYHGEDLSGLHAQIKADWSIPAEWRSAVLAYCIYREAACVRAAA